MNSDDDNPINRALGLSPLVSEKALSTIINKVQDDSAKEDFTFARANIREVVENANDAIAKLAMIADQSQNPRAFEVLAKLMDTTISASKHLLEIQKDIRQIEKPDETTNQQAKTVNNNMFVGSTAELQKMIQQMSGTKPDTNNQ
jgi:hypothetical protein